MTNYQLKPFNFNLADLQFILDQVNFVPLFDEFGNAIIAWDGIGAIYKTSAGATVLDNQYDTTGLTPAQAINAYGTSYASATAAQGLRDVTGLDNNLLLVNHAWGAVDQPFLRTVDANFDNYVKPFAAGSTGASYGNNTFAYTGPLNSTPIATDDQYSTPGSVTDYTPRMISRIITTGGATPLLDGNGQVVHFNKTLYDAATNGTYNDLIDTVSLGGVGLINGAAVMSDPGILAGGQHDPQDPTNGELFFGAINPGVAPGNSWLAYFGQFFDHGLDFVSKGADHTAVYIPLAIDDPLYRAPGTDGPLDPGNTRIKVDRADVSGHDDAGNPQYVNHTSPYIDQSQTYGSHEQMTNLLREWVLDPVSGTYKAGSHLLDGETSAAWTNAWGQTTHATLPTLNELREHLAATGRDDITWDDVGNLHNRDVHGNVTAGLSGQALLLDSNPKFDESHLYSSHGFDDIDHNGVQGSGESWINSALDLEVQAAIGRLTTEAGTMGHTFGMVGGVLTLTLGSDLVMGPTTIPAGTVLVDRAAMSLWVNIGTLSMTAPPGVTQDDVATVLLASVGDHYIAGDGRVNENIGLTTIHHVFHEEHNFQVRNIQDAIKAQDLRAVTLGDTSHTVAHNWQVGIETATGSGIFFTDAAGNYTVSDGGAISWDEGKLFDAAKLTVEMEYQHAAVDQYARTITPDIPEFVGYNSGENATVSLEYAQGAFRFGHSTMRETIDYMDPNGSITGKVMSVALEQAFLNPSLYAHQGAASIAMGMTHQQMNEIDELLTPAMNQGLLGQPLDLAAINIARGRDIGLPTLNDFREGVGLARYTSWSDFGANMVHPESLANFIAAYSLDGNVGMANAIVAAEAGSAGDLAGRLGISMDDATTYAIDFLNDTGSIVGSDGYNHIDTWIGGLAEVHVMGGLLGETFNLVFVDQINRLMDGDRFYYLYRLNNLNMGDEIANAQFKDIVERNTGLEHLNGSIFAYADQYVDLSAAVDPLDTTGSFKTDHKYADQLAAHPGMGVYSAGGISTSGNGGVVTVGGVQYIRDVRAEGAYGNANVNGTNLDGTPDTGANSNEVLIGTDHNDLLYMLAGDDTAYGEGGNDIIYGGAGIDRLYGGDGSDTIYGGDSGDLIDGGAGDDKLYGDSSGSAAAGVDQIIGSEGNDIIYGGIGIDKLSGGAGDDVIFGGGDTDAFTHGGDGNDYIDGESDGDLLWGDGGDDLIVGGDNQDIAAGLDGDDILRPGNPSSAMGGGPDEVLGGDGKSDAGNDGKGVGFDLIDFSDYVAATTGVDADFATQTNPLVAIDGTTPFPAWVGIEGLIGSRNNDTVLADGGNNWLFGGSGNDNLEGGAGDDLIVGDGIRLDSLIGTYSGSYSHDFDGASHRAFDGLSPASERVIGANGLLDVVGFEKHFTTMLQSAMFKDLELGGSTITTLNGIAGTRMGDGGTAGTADTAVFTGQRADYTIQRIDFVDAHGNSVEAYKVTDNGHVSGGPGDPARAATDGTDVVAGVEFFKFADATISPVVIAGGPTASVNLQENQIGATAIAATSSGGGTIAYTLSGADAGLFDISAAGVVTFKNAPNYELPSDTGADSHYNVTVTASNTLTGLFDTQDVTVNVTDIDEAGSGALHIPSTSYSDAGSAGSATAVSTVVDPDLVTTSNLAGALTTYQWQQKIGAGWSDIVGANTATLAGVSGMTARVTQSYMDLGGVHSFTSPETFIVGTSGNNAVATLTGTNGVDIILGLDGNDTLKGNDGDDTLVGGAGSDNLSGGAGNDTMIGGNGDDFYYVDSAGDVVTETNAILATGGYDRVYSSVSYGLGANVEYLSLTGTAVDGTGNDLVNTLVGNELANTLDGGIGADIMRGGDGSDLYIVDNGGDQVTELAGQGTDLVQSSVTYTLSSNAISGFVENLTLIGAAAINGTGNGLDNVITGNDGINILIGNDGADTLYGNGGADDLRGGNGNDTLFGGAGADALSGGTGDDNMIGGDGNDIYYVDSTADSVTETNATLITGGYDRVYSSVNYGLGGNVEFLAMTGGAAISGTGNALDNTLVGNAADNTLNGGSGNDILRGMGGNDTLIGGLGNDWFVFNTPLGPVDIDTITDFAVVDDTIQLDHLIYGALGATNGTLSADAFTFGSVAGDAGDRIIYDDLTGALYYDFDGIDGGAAVQIANIGSGLQAAGLSHQDFVII